jgi:hypothetical protein
MEMPGLLAARLAGPLVVAVCEYQAPPALERRSICRLFGDRLGPSVDEAVGDLRVLRPGRDQAPLEGDELILAGVGRRPDGRDLLCQRNVERWPWVEIEQADR